MMAKRIGAYFIDFLILGLCIGAIQRDAYLGENHIFYLITTLIWLAYVVGMTYYSGATLGKQIVGLKVVDLEGKPAKLSRVLLRESVYIALAALICILVITDIDVRPQENDVGLHLDITTLSGVFIVWSMIFSRLFRNDNRLFHEVASGTTLKEVPRLALGSSKLN